MKTFYLKFLVALIAASVFQFGCSQFNLDIFKKNDEDKKRAQQITILSILLLSQQAAQEVLKQNYRATIAPSQAANEAVREAALAQGGITYRDLQKPEKLLAYAKESIKQKYPFLKMTNLDATLGSCTFNLSNFSYTCDATISGTRNCVFGGTIRFNNVRVRMNGRFVSLGGGVPQSSSSGSSGSGSGLTANFSSKIEGNVSFTECKTYIIDWFSQDASNQVTLQGEANLDSKWDQTGTLSSETTGSGTTGTTILTYNGTNVERYTVEVRNFSIDGNPIPNQTNTSETNLRTESRTEVSSTRWKFSNTINGFIKLNDIVIKEFNNQKIEEEVNFSSFPFPFGF
ncbi:MAG: hypothetical protein NZ853_02715 [Leptospiraceae bacterium]|nr:hypothetical protein [Leptospiraceae bacterium]MDW7975091.1 hypothetical protein [Leptospiraceae bacterium]